MAQIVYTGFGELIENIKKKFPPRGNIIFSEIAPLTAETPNSTLQDCDLLLLGPLTADPVKQVQRAYQKNPLLSVAIQAFPDQLQKIKQALLMAYNVGNNVQCLSFDTARDIKVVLENAMLKTRQRKSLHRAAAQTVSSISANRDIAFTSPADFLENIFLGSIILDENKTVISANGAARSIFNLLEEKQTTVEIHDLFPNHFSFANLHDVAAQNGVIEAVTSSNHYLEIHPSIIKTEQHKNGYLLLIHDITGRVKAENQLKAKIDELEFLNQELDQFTDVVSHDFKTPITSIGLLTELVSAEQDPARKQQLVERIKASSDKLKDLLKGMNQLVDLKKGKADKIEDIRFEDRVGMALNEYQHLLAETGGKVTTDFASAPVIHYFQAHIDIFLSNLLTNAVKYRDPSRPLEITISTWEENNYLKLSVKDNGIGIDLLRDRHKLFQPFKRLTNLSTGSGLGLNMVKRMIEKENGCLEVYSTPGIGSEFIACLRDMA